MLADVSDTSRTVFDKMRFPNIATSYDVKQSGKMADQRENARRLLRL
jgi:hypothetical protein